MVQSCGFHLFSGEKIKQYFFDDHKCNGNKISIDDHNYNCFLTKEKKVYLKDLSHLKILPIARKNNILSS